MRVNTFFFGDTRAHVNVYRSGFTIKESVVCIKGSVRFNKESLLNLLYYVNTPPEGSFHYSKGSVVYIQGSFLHRKGFDLTIYKRLFSRYTQLAALYA